ncbi:MAG: ABC transporter [Comamonadaceae bacterium CG12_big_fil_rev_8_21_14_0_65_59_15]|nr:MAG: ABC transporter [Comamonadaceae bacterium CG12_big_fil_rev_8_21_14_0_65_59_15]
MVLKHIRYASASAVVLLCTACATGPNANSKDPMEPLNRGVYQFNDAVDRALVKPVATVYRDVLPSPVRTGVTNFFANLQDVWSAVNNALQLKPVETVESFMRFGVNTVFGFAGVLDIASEMRIARHTEDFGQTLGYWGVGAGPYVVLPLLGPSTLRDTAALPVDAQGNVVSQASDVPTRNSATAVNLLNRRSRLLDATKMLDQVALDPYTFTRDAFLQRRRSAVYDGNPPDEPEDVPLDDSAQSTK